ncbi:MAG: nucleotidyltransferase domain-containing protein [Candidatus Margulisbacteria bacterium]|nr:nucleotidyltransferase domain-containing protein [Candidatus Margulisiibacteriota bacterium]
MKNPKKRTKLKPQKIDAALIKTVTQKITDKFKPQKIILFGSNASGSPNQDSDLDLFIIMPSSLRRDERSREVSNLLGDRLFPLDVLVYTPDEIASSLKRGNSFIKEILEKGKILHES